MDAPAPSQVFGYTAGPVFAHVATFGAVEAGPLDAMVIFGGTTPDPMPMELQAAFRRHICRGERVLVLTHTQGQMEWVKALVALLLVPGGHA